MSLAFLKDVIPKLKGWNVQAPEEFETTISGKTFRVEGIAASHPDLGEMIGASIILEDDSSSAAFELVERISILEEAANQAKTHFAVRSHQSGNIIATIERDEVFSATNNPGLVFSKSNGVAIHDSWSKACQAAACELIERHLILESFYGKIRPERLNQETSLLLELEADYESSSYGLGYQMTDAYPHPIYVCVALLKPKDPGVNPQLVGFGAAFTEKEARFKAEKEVLQRAIFLHGGGELPTTEPDILPSADAHQDYHLYPPNHYIVLDWLAGKTHLDVFPTPSCVRLRFVDLSSPDREQLFVAKAISSDTQQLIFGKMDDAFYVSMGITNRHLHPIP